MTRDEAIKAMRNGNKVKHSSFNTVCSLTLNDKSNIPFLFGENTNILKMCDGDLECFFDSLCDNGWEIFKQKVKKKKTFYINLFPECSGPPPIVAYESLEVCKNYADSYGAFVVAHPVTVEYEAEE